MIQIVYIIDNKHLNSPLYETSKNTIEYIKRQIQLYKNLSFKIINVDTDLVTRQEYTVLTLTKYPWLRAFEDGKIIDNWNVKLLSVGHWDNWAKKWGQPYTQEEYEAIRYDANLKKIEEERKLLEEKLNEQKKLLEQSNNLEKSTQENLANINNTKKLLFIGAAVVGLLFLFKK